MEAKQIQGTDTGDDAQFTGYRFPYPYLPNDGEHFRLLQLYGDEEDLPLRSELFTCRRDNWKEQYFAMSYVWGQEEDGGTILINDIGFPIRKNLYDFLLAFRRYMCAHGLPWAIVWTDALCIDQKTTGEKNHQVQIMSNIFRNAACVFSWLGHGNSYIESLLQDIKGISGRAPPKETAFRDWHSRKAPGELASLEYWTRLWVVPEILLARKQISMYGKVACPGDDLLTIALKPEYRNTRLNFIREAKYNFSSPDIEVPLPQLFHRFGCLGCSLDHDRIFALLGVCNEINGTRGQDLQVDYEMSKVDLLVRTIPEVSPFPGYRALYIQNFVFMLGLTLNEIDQANSTLIQQLSSVVHVERTIVPISTMALGHAVLSGDGPSTTQIQKISLDEHLLAMTGYEYFYGNELSVLPLETGFIVALEDMLSLHPANPRFPVDFAALYSTGFVCRTTGYGTVSEKRICGVVIQSRVLEWTSQRPIPAVLQAELKKLQLESRKLSVVAADEGNDTYRHGSRHQPFSGLQYLRFLAQFRTVVLLLQAYGRNFDSRSERTTLNSDEEKRSSVTQNGPFSP